jgi:uncharacterized protein YdeI (YjbR/CyaY-like superfamily)
MWSELNKRRVRQMIKEGRMTEAGLTKVREAKQNGRWDAAAVRQPTPDVPPELSRALARNKKAREHFAGLAPSYRRQFIGWIAVAKRAETRQRRVAEVVQLLAEKKKLGMK